MFRADLRNDEERRKPGKEATMFQNAFITGPKNFGMKAWALPLSLVSHAAIATVLVILPLLDVGNLPRYKAAIDTFISVPHSPSPPPPPPRKSSASRAKRIKPVQTQTSFAAGKLVAPVEIPDQIAEEQISGIGIEGGVEGGVDGGLLGSDLNGIIGPILNVVLGEVEAPLRASGEIRQPRRIKAVAPEYPEIARQARVEGIVIIEATTDIYGRVQNMKVLRSIPLLDQAALDAVRQWVYEPMIINGRPRGVIFTVTVTFKLKS